MLKLLTLFGFLSIVSSLSFKQDIYKQDNNLTNIITKLNTSSIISFSYKSCGVSTDLAQNLLMSVNPELPQTDYTFYLDYDLSKDVNSGTSQYAVNFNGIPLAPTNEILCDEVSKSNITCPIKAGHIESQSKGSVPTGVSGKAVIKNQWFNENSERILCIEYTIKLT
jgi:hypothetical protein